MAVGFDFGTMNLVAARKDEQGNMQVSAERNCFLDTSTDWEDVLKANKSNYIKQEENGEERLFVVGKDALNLANLYAGKDLSGDRQTALRRAMQDMVLNSKSDKKSVQMLKYMSQNLIGPPKKEGEVCVVSIPANPIDGKFNNTFHSQMCQSFIRELGYEVHPIDEFLAVVFANNPTMEEEGEVVNMTGIGISWGAGGTNCGVAYKGQPTVNFAVPMGGDWIDKQVSSVTSLTTSEACIAKEKAFDVKNPTLDLGAPNLEDEIHGAIYIYYQNLITTIVKEFKKQFLENKINFSSPIEIVISGGTSRAKGFDTLFEQVVKQNAWPFEIKGVRRAKEPLAATAVGALTAAISKEKAPKS